LLAAVVLAANAQAPAEPGDAARQLPATPEQNKARNEPVRAPSPRSSVARPGSTPAPMDIRIQEEGVKLPKCTTESREGEACKK